MKVLLAHRGLIDRYPENSLMSILDIFNYKSDKFKLGVEFDITLTKDNKLILFHDNKISNIEIINLTYNEIKQINKDIPLLEDIFVHFQNMDYILNIELKGYPKSKLIYCNLLIDLLHKYDNILYFTSTFNKEIYNILISNDIKCYLISDKHDKPSDIVHYSQINGQCKGVYTLYDEDFDDIYLDKIHNIDILITDDIKKLIDFLS
jgi:glycerophosphoryl diester phosphodiesterase